MGLGDKVLEDEAVVSAIKSSLPERYLEDNLRAYNVGFNAFKSLHLDSHF